MLHGRRSNNALSRPAAGQTDLRPGAERRARRWKQFFGIRTFLLLPTFCALAFVTIIPLGFTIYASFTNWHFFNYSGGIRFTGLQNWTKLLRDNNFLVALRNTVVFVVIATPLQYLIGLAVAVALDYATFGKRFFRILFWLPLMMGSVLVTGIVGRMMYDPVVGPLNTLAGFLGFTPIPWLADRRMAMASIIIVDVWWGTAFIIMMLLAGLQSLPTEMNEAAQVDGATDWQVFRHITFPLLAPVSAAVVLLRVVDNWKVFDIINVLTGGGPGRATQSVSLLIYQAGVRGGNISYASAMAWMLTIMIAVTAWLIFRLTRRYQY